MTKADLVTKWPVLERLTATGRRFLQESLIKEVPAYQQKKQLRV